MLIFYNQKYKHLNLTFRFKFWHFTIIFQIFILLKAGVNVLFNWKDNLWIRHKHWSDLKFLIYFKTIIIIIINYQKQSQFPLFVKHKYLHLTIPVNFWHLANSFPIYAFSYYHCYWKLTWLSFLIESLFLNSSISLNYSFCPSNFNV